MIQACSIERNKDPAAYAPHRMTLTHKRQPPQPPSWDGSPLSPPEEKRLEHSTKRHAPAYKQPGFGKPGIV